MVDVVIRAVDRATATIGRINARIQSMFAPLRRLAESLRNSARAGGLDRLQASFGRVGKSIGRVGTEARKLFGGIAKYGGIAALALGTFVVAQSEAGDALGNNAKRAGLTVDAYAQYAAAAEDAGIEQEAFTSSIDSFGKSLGELRAGKGKLSGFLKDVSPNLLLDLKKASDTEAALKVAFRALGGLEDVNKKAALSSKLFANLEMVQVVDLGARALDKTNAAYLKAYGSQQAFVDGAKGLDNQLDSLKQGFRAVSRRVATEMFPAFTKLAGMLEALFLDNKDDVIRWAEQFGKASLKFVEDLPKNLEKLERKFKDLKATLQPLADKFGGFGNLLGVVAGLIVTGPLLGAIASLAVAFVSLGIAIGATPLGWLLLSITALSAAAGFFIKDWEPVQEFFGDLFQNLKDMFGGFIDFLAGVFTGDLKRAWDGIKRVFGGQLGLALMPLSMGDNIVKAFKKPASKVELADIQSDAERFADDGVAGLRLPDLPSLDMGSRGQLRTLGADRARPRTQSAAAPQVVTQNAAVTVKFENTPPGTKIRPARGNTASLGLDVGKAPELAR